MDLERLKEKRRGLRTSFTKYLGKIETILNSEITEEYTKLMKIEELLRLKAQLLDKQAELVNIDYEIQTKIKVKDIAEDVAGCEEYREKGIDVKTKLERLVDNLNDRPLPGVIQIARSSDQTGIGSENLTVRTETRSTVKLPKLQVVNFLGDCSSWLDFWNSFEVAIHNNNSLSKIEKFSYLKSFLGGVALSAVSGFSLTESNYDASIQLLKERFGRSDVIISSHMHKLLLIEPVKSCANVTELRRMYDAIEVQIRSLQSLNVATGTYSNLLCPVILQKLPEELNLSYNRQRNSDELFDISKLVDFIRKELEIREASIILANPRNNSANENNFRNKMTGHNKPYLNSKRSEYHPPKSSASVLATQAERNLSGYHNRYSYDNNRPKFNNKRNTSSFSQNTGVQGCLFCSSAHMNHDCSLNVYDKKKALMAKGLCFICFSNHLSKFCSRKDHKCKYCASPWHNSLICNTERNESRSVEDKKQIQSESSLNLVCNKNKELEDTPNDSVLLQTVTASVFNIRAKCHLLRCLIDNGSSRTFVLREVCNLLGLKTIGRETLLIYTFGNENTERKTYDIVEIVLHNVRETNKKIKLRAVVIDSITFGEIKIPSQWVRNIALEKGIELADKGNLSKIHVLIGSDYIGEILGERNVRISKRLMATDTLFGFVIQGKERDPKALKNCQKVRVNHLHVVKEELDHQRVKNLWELEAIGINPDKEHSKSDDEILELFRQTTTYRNKRYETRLLWKNNVKELDSNYEIARRRLSHLNTVFGRNPDLYFKYKEIIEEHLKLGIIEEVASDLNENTGTGYYMPHHAVVREQKKSSKVRIVFDGSCKGRDELSLNDCLESGPNLNPDLLRIILRFRLHPVAFCADIQRAFLEVGIADEDRNFLKFLWNDGEGPDLHSDAAKRIRTLQFCRVPFGVKCSPFLLSATIRLHLKKFENDYPEATEILRSLYVDDLISGTDDVNKALQLSKEMMYILGEASMNLRAWISNSSKLNQLWKTDNFECREDPEESNVELKILGIIWDNTNDVLLIDTSQFNKLPEDRFITKRYILAVCGMLFDPLGIMNPFLIRIKIILQSVWENGKQWDEPVPHEIEMLFLEWLNEAKNLKFTGIPRLYFNEFCWNSVEVHIFSDASPKCYGSVAYFRFTNSEECKTSFIISKSRLAPLKKITLPRLELLGTLVSARLGSYLKSVFPMLDPRNIFYWTDSQICLHWIKGSVNDYKQFVKNRVIEIKEKTDPEKWHFCKGKVNPADKLTRGVKANSLMNDKVWSQGPAWLSELSIPYDSLMEFSCDMDSVVEERHGVTTLQVNVEVPMPLLNLENYSTLNRVLRTTAYVFRFLNNIKSRSEKRSGALTANEISAAENYWLLFVQQSEFNKEYTTLKAKNSVSPDSKLYNLNPILTTEGLIVLKGRIQGSNFSDESKHPIILPNKARFTNLLIMKEHENLGHSGISDTLTQLRERFWIIKGRQAVKSCLNKCFLCRRFKAKQGQQITAPLPIARTSEAQPFEVVGIDFAGPLFTRDNNKSYIALFTCAVTRAVHLEIVSSLSSEHFLLAFRRFISRRGMCKVVNSDNALTFKGSEKELKKLYMNIKNFEIQNYFGNKGIKWNYIVERASWWGGYWERMVRMTKVILRKILGRALVTFEELQTILAEIESIINSRPLTYVYNDPVEPFPLTPAHFLIGKRSTALPPQSGRLVIASQSSSQKLLIKRYLYRERLLNEFWKRWKFEYILQLRNANVVKPVNPISNFNIGDIVLIGDDKAPRQIWRLGKVIETHVGRDNKVRSVTLKTSSGMLKRPIQLLCNLEVQGDLP